MDIVIADISEQFLNQYIDRFIEILKEEPFEYWDRENFMRPLPFKFDLSKCALIDGKIIGYIIASKKGDDAYIHKFMVDLHYRNNQVGQKLELAFEKRVREHSLAAISLCVLVSNEGALRFYLRNGFIKDQQRIDNITKSELTIMKKILT
jgi:ribosomal protein S18 acetylase RimI-like enzyme